MQNVSRANIVLLGRSGEGKSSFINYLVGNNVAPTGCGESVTKAFDEYEYILRNGISIRIFDSKGLEVDDYKNAIDEIIKFVNDKSKSSNVIEWLHSIFYCVNLNRARLEPKEEDLIRTISKIVGYPINIVITHCGGTNSIENERSMKEKIFSDLGENIKVYCVNSVEKRTITGEIIHRFGKEIIVSELIDLLWDNTARKIASNYAFQLRSGLIQIINGIKKEQFDWIDSTNYFDLKRGGITWGSLKQSSDCTIKFIQETNSSFSKNINDFLNMYRLFANSLGSKHIEQFSPYKLSYDVLLEESLDKELENWYIKRSNEISHKKGIEALIDNVDHMINYRETFKEPVIYLCKIMTERIPSAKKIENDIYEMLLGIKTENSLHSPSIRIIRKIGANEPCPCGSGKKFKKCCKNKGIYD